jgi:hypothetical protein
MRYIEMDADYTIRSDPQHAKEAPQSFNKQK